MSINKKEGERWYLKPLPIKVPVVGFELMDEEMITLKITPDYNVSNTDNDAISKAIASTYETPMDRLNILRSQYKKIRQTHFDIVLAPKEAAFYMTISKEFADLIESKMETVWKGCAIQRVERSDLGNFDIDKTEVCELVLRDYNFKSISTSKGDLYPLTNMLGITRDLLEGERIRIHIAMQPMKRRDWIAVAKDEYKQFEKGKVVDKQITDAQKAGMIFWQGLEMAANLYIEFKMLFFECILGLFMPEEKKEKHEIAITINSLEEIKENNMLKGLSNETTYKMTSEAINVKMNIISQSDSKERRKINMISVANSYKDLQGDNEVVVRNLSEKKQKKELARIENFRITPKKNVFSDREVSKLIQLPQKTLQEEYKLDRIDTREVDIVEELLQGGIRAGVAELKGKDIDVFHPRDKNSQGRTWIIASGQGGGKTTLGKNIMYDSYKMGNANIVLEYLQNCQICRDLQKVIPAEDLVVINADDMDNLAALAYPEASQRITDEADKWEKLKVANMLAHQVKYLIDTVSDEKSGELTNRMTRFLNSAAMAVFIHPSTTVNDVFGCLRDHNKRQGWVNLARKSGLFEKDDEIFYDLEELDKKDKGRTIGTRDDLIAGILNRIAALTMDVTIKEMLRKPISYEHDFIKYIEEGKTILIKIPEKDNLKNPSVRDTISTYWFTRIWLCLQMREQGSHNRMCKILFDEIENTPTLTEFISHHVHEFRRHQLGAIFTVHYMEQFKKLLTPIMNVGMSIQFLAGAGEQVYKNFLNLMQPFTLEDGLNLKQFQALNIINYGNQYSRFIAWLPPKPEWAED
ncbi:hypothetical protein [Anaerosolibacter sp.]|uniref:hypothetical protein n=1 Tax=Anaerosolibacter sp. TaxID=1872527 RepID=UPI0039EE9D6E